MPSLRGPPLLDEVPQVSHQLHVRLRIVPLFLGDGEVFLAPELVIDPDAQLIAATRLEVIQLVVQNNWIIGRQVCPDPYYLLRSHGIVGHVKLLRIVYWVAILEPVTSASSSKSVPSSGIYTLPTGATY